MMETVDITTGWRQAVHLYHIPHVLAINMCLMGNCWVQATSPGAKAHLQRTAIGRIFMKNLKT